MNLAPEEFIKKRKTAEVLALFGTVEYDQDYDYKEARRRDTTDKGFDGYAKHLPIKLIKA